MTVTLARAYNGYQAGTVVQLNTPTEAALIQQGYAYISTAPISGGNVTTLEYSGRVIFPAGAQSLTITHPNFRPSSKMYAAVAQPVADATGTNVTRILAALGSITIYLNAAPTSDTVVDWSVPTKSGMAASSLQRNNATYPAPSY